MEIQKFKFDVVVPVYNAYSQVVRCLTSVVRHSTVPYRLILVNDGSEEAVSQYLRRFAEKHSNNTVLLENRENLGFVKTVNKGLTYQVDGVEDAPIKLLLNSDTVVTSEWLEKIARAFESDPKVGIACPLSNNAHNLSTPIPEGYNVESYGELIGSHKVEHYPDITTSVGFCMAFRKEILNEVGLFDLAFAAGYGEESDFHFKVLCEGYRAVLVPDCFVYHEGEASFDGKRDQYINVNRPLFDRRWKIIYLNELENHDQHDPVGQVEAGIEVSKLSEREHDILFILPTPKLFGGIVVVYELINRLISRGVDANALILSEREQIQMDLQFSPYFYPDNRWKAGLPKSKAYVATHFQTVPYAIAANSRHPDSKLVYLIQGYEGWFPGASLDQVVKSYKAIPNRVGVSSWIKDMLGKSGDDCVVIPNGVDTGFFTPPIARNSSKRRLNLFLMMRHDPQGGMELGIEIIARLREKRVPVDITVVGNGSKDPRVISLVDQAHISASRKEIRDIYQKSDIFLDCSMVQGFGLMGLEAMACGVATVISRTGGVREYANEDTSILCNLGDLEQFVRGVEELVNNRPLREKLQQNGRAAALRLDWESIADRYQQYFEDLLEIGKEISVDNLRAQLEYYFGELFKRNQLEGAFTKGVEVLKEEGSLSHTPRGALEVLNSEKLYTESTVLNSTHEGLGLIDLYETLRCQARDPEWVADGDILGKVKKIVANQ